MSSTDLHAAADVAAPSRAGLLRRRLTRHGGAMVGGAVLALIFLVAIAAPLLAPHDPLAQDLARRLVPPVWQEGGTWEHPLGTDPFGRDYLSRVLYGARTSLLIGFVATAIAGAIGTTLGVAAGYAGGRVDAAVTFLVTTRLAMPVVLLALALAQLVGSSLGFTILVLGLLNWDHFAVVMRSATRQVASRDYVTAARAAGLSHARVVWGEVMPNVTNHLVVVATLEVAHAILLEAALSFLGLGVQPPTPSWGLMIAEAKGLMLFEFWLIAIPGAALFALVLSINLLGDGLRDVLAPEGRL